MHFRSVTPSPFKTLLSNASTRPFAHCRGGMMRVALRLSLGRRSFENSRLTQTRQPTLQAILTLAPSTPPNIGPMLLARCDARDILVCAVPLPEKALIQRIRAQTLRTRKIRIGIGDDCSVVRIPPGHEVLVTTD